MIGSGLRNGFLYIALRILPNKKRFKDEENYFVWNEVVELVLELLLNIGIVVIIIFALPYHKQ